MTKPNMKPYDPSHTGEFCTRDEWPVRILATDRKSLNDLYPIVGVYLRDGIEYVRAWMKEGYENATMRNGDNGADLMCVIPKREARVRWIDQSSYFAYTRPSENTYEVREVMPDDISQEHARAVIEAAREVTADLTRVFGNTGHVGMAVIKLRAALGDDA